MEICSDKTHYKLFLNRCVYFWVVTFFFFYRKKVLQMSNGFEEFGQIRWELVACLFIVWVLVYFSLWKSVRSSGKVLYFTASLPFALVLIFLGHSLSLEGAELGLKYLFLPKWELLLDSKVLVLRVILFFYFKE